MRKVNYERPPVIFNWEVVDINVPENSIAIQFHSGGTVTLKSKDCEVNLAHAKALGSLIRSHTTKRFDTFGSIKREFDLIRESIRQEHRNNAS